jgi:hypothetical protein
MNAIYTCTPLAYLPVLRWLDSLFDLSHDQLKFRGRCCLSLLQIFGERAFYQ